MAAESFLRLLQFSDGLFPAGGYAHSFGLETLVQSGRVQNAAGVSSFLQTYLEASAAPTDTVAVLCAKKYSLDGNLEVLVRLDQLLDALKPAAETREASRQMGRQTLRVLRELLRDTVPSCHPERSRRTDQDRSPEPAARVEGALFGAVEKSAFPFQGAATTPHLLSRAERSAVEGSTFSSRPASANVHPPLITASRLGGRSFSSDITADPQTEALATEEQISSHAPLATSHFCSRYASAVESAETPCHHSIVFGLAAALHGWERRETASAFLYATSAMIVGASLRLLPLGQLAGQRILAQAGTLIATLAETAIDKTEDDMWSFTPEIEIAAMRHESLDGRLFRS